MCAPSVTNRHHSMMPPYRRALTVRMARPLRGLRFIPGLQAPGTRSARSTALIKSHSQILKRPATRIDSLASLAHPPGACGVQNRTRFCRTKVLIGNVPQPDTRKARCRGPFWYLAGGQGFEPWLAESESAVLPLDDPPNPPRSALTLRVLRRTTCLSQTDLLALDFACVACHKSSLA